MKAIRFLEVSQLPKRGISNLPDKLWSFIWFFLSQARFPFFFAAFIFGLAATCQTLIPVFLKGIVDNFTAQPGDINLNEIAWLMIGMVTIGHGGYHFFWSMGNYFSGPSFHAHFREMIRSQLFSYLSRHGVSFFQDDFAGRIANKIDVAGFAIAQIVEQFHYIVWTSIIGTIAVSIIFASLDITMLALFLIWLIFYIAFCIYFVPKSSPKAAATADSHSRFVGTLVDIIGNIITVKLFARNAQEREKVNDYAKDAAETCRDFYIFWFQFRAILGLFAVILAGAISAWSFYGYIGGWLSAGDVVLGLTALPMVLSNTWILATNAAEIAEHLGMIEDAIKAIIKPQQLRDAPYAEEIEITSRKSKIHFDDVRFHYGKESGVIEKLNLEIPAGQKVGLIGRSGAGKSTLVNLLLRFYDVEKGEIKIGNQDIVIPNNFVMLRAG